MGTAYPETLFEKRKYVQSLFPGHEVDLVVGMEDPYHYRNKVYATFGYDRNENLIAGMYEEYSHDLVTVPDCMIQNETANHIIASLTAIASKMPYPFFSRPLPLFSRNLRKKSLKCEHTYGIMDSAIV